jgi:hypothetical protein
MSRRACFTVTNDSEYLLRAEPIIIAGIMIARLAEEELQAPFIVPVCRPSLMLSSD